MLSDDSANVGGRRAPRNVLGEPLDICSFKPMTGFYRGTAAGTLGERILAGTRSAS
jgi:uncharacterized protein (DUF2237 family)